MMMFFFLHTPNTIESVGPSAVRHFQQQRKNAVEFFLWQRYTFFCEWNSNQQKRVESQIIALKLYNDMADDSICDFNTRHYTAKLVFSASAMIRPPSTCIIYGFQFSHHKIPLHFCLRSFSINPPREIPHESEEQLPIKKVVWRNFHTQLFHLTSSVIRRNMHEPEQQ